MRKLKSSWKVGISFWQTANIVLLGQFHQRSSTVSVSLIYRLFSWLHLFFSATNLTSSLCCSSQSSRRGLRGAAVRRSDTVHTWVIFHSHYTFHSITVSTPIDSKIAPRSEQVRQKRCYAGAAVQSNLGDRSVQSNFIYEAFYNHNNRCQTHTSEVV